MPNRTPLNSTPPPPLAQFPILEEGLYFNHAAIGPWPRCTTEAVQAFAEENMSRGPAAYRKWIARENELRQNLARMISATSTDTIALLKNTTEGICTVAYGLDWQAGDNLVLPRGEFSSNRLPWLAQATRGVEIREVDIRAADNAETALCDAMDQNTRLLTVSAVQWNDGFRLDLHALGKACQDKNVLFFVDAIQQLGALPLDVEACRIDFLAADAHKWLLAPEGIAVFYCSDVSRPRLQLLQQGWHMYEHPWKFDRADWTPALSAKRFEAGSPNSVGQAAFAASVNLLLDYEMTNVERRVLANTDYLIRNLEELPGIRICSAKAPERRSGIVSFTHQSLSVQFLQRELVLAGMSCAVRDNSIRLSPHFYQGESQLFEFMEILQSVISEAN